MKKNFSVLLSFGLSITGLFGASIAAADVGLGLRAGFPTGGSLDFNVGLSERFSARIAYNYLELDEEVEDTDVTYDATFETNGVSGYLDWYPFAGGFRVSLGAVGSQPKFKVDGRPAPGETVEINGRTYNASQIGSLSGEVKLGNSVAPFLGIGYGNVVGKNHRLTFLFDLGVVYAGKPDVSLNATCGAALNQSQCNQLRADVEVEKVDLQSETEYEFYPVINFGLGIRF